MSASAPLPLAAPPWIAAATGEPRRVGVELEMGGIDLEKLAGVVADTFDLVPERIGRYEWQLRGDPAGAWLVEVDSSVLKKMGRRERDRRTVAGEAGASAEAAVALVVEAVMPVEVVSPPLPLRRLGEVERLIGQLRAAGAKGSSERLISAFGLQINPEAPSLETPAVTAMLKAFLCLYDWLAARAKVDLSRRMTTFVDPFPRAYVRRVVDPGYSPDQARLIEDYLRWNATRNRALDLLPLLAHLDAERVRAAVRDERVKGRPAYHYRLPNCDIHREGWTLAASWNDWVEVERLAGDTERLAGCGAAYAAFLASAYDRWTGDWAAEVERAWLGR
jgi:hypothetical protein